MTLPTHKSGEHQKIFHGGRHPRAPTRGLGYVGHPIAASLSPQLLSLAGEVRSLAWKPGRRLRHARISWIANSSERSARVSCSITTVDMKVLVLGAGASRPAGYPLGADLIGTVAAHVASGVDQVVQWPACSLSCFSQVSVQIHSEEIKS